LRDRRYETGLKLNGGILRAPERTGNLFVAGHSSRPGEQFSSAIGAATLHGDGAVRAEGTFIAANPGIPAILRERYGAPFAFGPHFERHLNLFSLDLATLPRA
jgi:hypothetical protein